MPGLNTTLLPRDIKFWIKKALFQIFIPGIEWGKDDHITGFPRVWTIKKKQIKLGDNVLLNSTPRGYHAGMAFPVTLITDRSEAQISIGDGSHLHGCCIHAWSTVTIGDRCLFASGSQILDANGHVSQFEGEFGRLGKPDNPEPILIDDDCWICINAIILKGVHLGEGSIVTAGSVVLSGNYPPFSLLSGNPARIIKTLSHDIRETLSAENMQLIKMGS